MQKVVVARMLYRCPSCGHVTVGNGDHDACPQCPTCGSGMMLATATSEAETQSPKKS